MNDEIKASEPESEATPTQTPSRFDRLREWLDPFMEVSLSTQVR